MTTVARSWGEQLRITCMQLAQVSGQSPDVPHPEAAGARAHADLIGAARSGAPRGVINKQSIRLPLTPSSSSSKAHLLGHPPAPRPVQAVRQQVGMEVRDFRSHWLPTLTDTPKCHAAQIASFQTKYKAIRQARGYITPAGLAGCQLQLGAHDQ